jgi:hypothetical protein
MTDASRFVAIATYNVMLFAQDRVESGAATPATPGAPVGPNRRYVSQLTALATL